MFKCWSQSYAPGHAEECFCAWTYSSARLTLPPSPHSPTTVSCLFVLCGVLKLDSVMVDLISSMINHNVLEVIFSYLDLRDLKNCAVVCRSWKHFLDDENSDVWRSHCMRKLPEEALKSDLLSSVPTYKMKLRAYYHAWNPNDCSRNVYIKPNGFTLHRWVEKPTIIFLKQCRSYRRTIERWLGIRNKVIKLPEQTQLSVI